MIKLLRTIRRNFITEGKVRNYLMYAIGEIVLVVIGILIALAINNWNVRLQTEHKTVQFLKDLKTDLQSDLNELNYVVESQNERYNLFKEALSLSKKPDLSSILANDSIPTYRAGRNNTFFPVAGTYKAASNTGIIEHIKDEELKRSIVNLYEHLYVRVNLNAQIIDERTGYIDWESRHYIDNEKRELYFSKKALLDSDFISQIGYLNRFIDLYIMRCGNTRSGIEEVLGNIEEYLEAHD